MDLSELMSRYVVRISYDESAARAAELMRRNRIGILPVVQGDRVVGVLTDRDLVTRCLAPGAVPIETAVDRIMTRPAVSVEWNAPVGDVLTLMARHQVKRLPVTRQGNLIGMVSLSDLPPALSDTVVADAYRKIFSGAPSSGGNAAWESIFSSFFH